MTQTEAEVAVVDDVERNRKDLNGIAENLKGEGSQHSVAVPPSFEEMQRLFLFHNLDGLLIDVNLEHWQLPKKLIMRVKGIGPILDGIDVANLAFNLYRKAKDAICLYSSRVDLDEPRWANKIARLPFTPPRISKLSTYQQVKTYFKQLLEKADKVRTVNPLLQPPNFAKLSPSDRLQAFKAIYFANAKWIACNFDTVGDYAWTVVCGHNVEKDYYGSPLNGGRGGQFGITPMSRYPDLKAMKALAKRRNYFPFIVWNTRRPEFIEHQFREAGAQLNNIPPMWRSFFGIAMAQPCTRAYVDEREHRVLQWCRELDEVGVIAVMKRIYKRLLGRTTSNLSDFKRAAVRYELPQIVDVLKGKVEEIDEDESRAVVWLKSPRGGVPFTEVFDLMRLRRAHIRFVDQRFDYIVYQQPHGGIVVHVEAVYPEEDEA